MTDVATTSMAPAAEPRVSTEEVVVLDYGGQYSQLIARRVRELGVFSELFPHHVGVEEVARRRPCGLILSGGPASVYSDGAPALDRRLPNNVRRLPNSVRRRVLTWRAPAGSRR